MSLRKSREAMVAGAGRERRRGERSLAARPRPWFCSVLYPSTSSGICHRKAASRGLLSRSMPGQRSDRKAGCGRVGEGERVSTELDGQGEQVARGHPSWTEQGP